MGDSVYTCLCRRGRDRWTANVEAREFVSEGAALGCGSDGEETMGGRKEANVIPPS